MDSANNAQPTTEELLAQLVAMSAQMNEYLRRQEEDRKASDEAAAKKDLEATRQSAATLSLQMASSGSIIAIFVASLDVALLAYAHDVLSDRGDATPIKFTDRLAISCWLVSLMISLIVVLIGTYFTFAQSWAMFAGLAKLMGVTSLLRTDEPSAAQVSEEGAGVKSGKVAVDGDGDGGDRMSLTLNRERATSRPQSPKSTSSSLPSDSNLPGFTDFDTQITITLVGLVFNTCAVPSLIANIIGLLVFTWNEQPRQSAISITVMLGVFWLALVLMCLITIVRMLLRKEGDSMNRFERAMTRR